MTVFKVLCFIFLGFSVLAFPATIYGMAKDNFRLFHLGELGMVVPGIFGAICGLAHHKTTVGMVTPLMLVALIAYILVAGLSLIDAIYCLFFYKRKSARVKRK